jgi:hypothetical protein
MDNYQSSSLRDAAPVRRSSIWAAFRLFLALWILVGLGIPSAQARNPNLIPGVDKPYVVYLAIIVSNATDTFGPQPVLPKITSSPVTEAVVGQQYSYAVIATGTPAPTYSLAAAPDGMTIHTTTGLISWMPPAAGIFNVTVRASNDAGAHSQSFTIGVSLHAIPPAITSTPVTAALTGRIYNYAVEASGYPSPSYR